MKKIIIIAAIALTILACAKEKTHVRSMEEIYKEEGVPVLTSSVTADTFSKEITFNATLTGNMQSFETAALTGRIKKVHAKIGEKVVKNQIIVSFPADNPSAGYSQAKAAYENAKSLAERTDELYKIGGVSLQDLENAQTSYKVSKANWDNVCKLLIVKAPISGIITEINVRETDNVEDGAPLFTVAKLSTMKAKIWINESDILAVKKGMEVSVMWKNIQKTGKIVSVSMAMDNVMRAFAAEVEIDNADLSLKTGVTAEIRVVTVKKDAVIFVPIKLVKTIDANSIVWCATDGKAVGKKVKVGIRNDDMIEIVSGLTTSDVLITAGHSQVKNGSKLRLNK